ncbi:MAG: excinuclease ABC subunit UvrC [Ruminococcaceae bacterium]|nr:excinuclease ABC subunit UvrC [Oscillospiraceae bacterium]
MEDRLERLREKAAQLPLRPGVYIMKNSEGKVVYVGKSRALKNRVSQYFAKAGKHDPKTEKMVASVHDFEYMITDLEIEALSLENRLIKLYQPKFNIKLKDDKNYPYVRLSIKEEYPGLSVVRKRSDDGAKYFGPYSSAATAYEIINTARKTFGTACCKKKFPDDIGKSRPCLYYHIGQCCGVCTGNVSSEEYRETFKDVAAFLNGSFSGVKSSLEQKMYEASEDMRYEAAVKYRDRLKLLSGIWQKQKVSCDPSKERDVAALYSDELCSVISVFCVRDGALCDSSHFEFPSQQIADGSSAVSFLCDLYMKKEYIPKEILLDFEADKEDIELLELYLSDKAGYSVKVKTPERGDLKALCAMVYENAEQHAKEYQKNIENDTDILLKLSNLLSLEVLPERIEAYDISNFGNDNMTAGMICLENGKFSKKNYRIYGIKSQNKQDDYGAMREALSRRLAHREEQYPDLILLDGGAGHVNTIKSLMEEIGVCIPVFGMVKDDFHKTRSLSDGDGEISIARDRALFTFIYKIQEEVHRFSISRMKKAKSRSLTSSVLTEIEGIGEKKASALLEHFKSIEKIKKAEAQMLCSVKGISAKDAERILEYFKKDE